MESFFSFALVLLILNHAALISSKSFFNFTTDQHALLAFKNSLTSGSVLSKNWSINASTCDWIGVSCGIKHRRVTALNVSGFELRGTVAPHLGNLTFLRSLDISSNNFTGSIPSELSNLHRLKEINVGVNSFTGEIPSWFGALSKLQHMRLNNNSFSGRIPLSLFNIPKLKTLDMRYNLLDGNLPKEIGNFSYLETLRLGGNKFTGSIPYGIFNVSSLTEINMKRNRLSGTLPNYICSNTPKLRIISLSMNQLYGEIPANIYKCRELEKLVLPLNHFNGNIPSEIGSLTMLRNLALWSNNLKGHIPNQFGNLTFLEDLSLGDNNLTGGIPKEIGNLTSLKNLLLYENNLAGELPQELANLPVLENLWLGNTSLSGSIPYSIFNISTLIVLDLSFNQFMGNLPSNMGISLFNLKALHLQNNRLSGSIPSSITNASMLIGLSMNRNSFSGSIPNFGNLEFLRRLVISGNILNGAESPTQEMRFLSPLNKCRYLEVLHISGNPLNGVLPTSIGNLSTSLLKFFASNCNIKGVIPSEIGNLSNLLEIHLYKNQISGPIPTTIGELKQLQRLDLFDNQLQGYIPNELCQMSNLGELYLSGNSLTCDIPDCLGELKSLRYIYLDSNNLNSTIPSKIWNLRDLVALNLSSNYLSGQISSQVGNLKAIYQIDLSSNQLSGDIPSSIDGCQNLEYLYLSNNKFRGVIPQSLGSVKGLTNLDLSHNNFFGFIPKSLEDLHLQYFNVSYNKLEGEIPNRGCFFYFTAQSFVNNTALCGATKFKVPPCLENYQGSRSKSVVKLMKYVMPSLISTIILVIVILMLIRRRNQKTIPPSSNVSLGIEWRRISYRELERGTSSFSESNLIGRGSFGSVFKGTLFDGLNVAVKVFNMQLDGAIKSFDTESKILSKIRHKNLVRIIGCCSNSEFRALILAYMPNGSLEKWLYSDTCHLDLVLRLRIAIDVAFALEYLHHGLTLPIVHCDIKPSNVLLDEDMAAHVGDFGIAKLFDSGEAITQTETLATVGYAAPEYGSEGRISTRGDVYSYGIMLLEMFTRKKPTDDIFSGEMSLKQWVSEALQENAISEIVAPDLLSREDPYFFAKEKCVSSIFHLAMKCLAVSPTERINMIEVTASLQKIKATIVAEI